MGRGGKIADTGAMGIAGIGGKGGCCGITVVAEVEVVGIGGAGGLFAEVEVVTLDVDAEAAAEEADVVDVVVVLDAAIVINFIEGIEDTAVEIGPESCGLDGPIRSFSSSGLHK